MNKQFKVGDHVVIERSNVEWLDKFAGAQGVITDVRGDGPTRFNYRVRPDGWAGELGVWCAVKCLVDSNTDSNNKIVITTDGTTTNATLYCGKNKVRTASAKCSPEDEFDFGIGAKIAMERLYPDKIEPKKEPTPKYLSCKFVLTSNSGEKIPRFTEGKVYELTHGAVRDDYGNTWPMYDAIKDEADLRAYFARGNGKRTPYSGISAKVIIIKE